MFGMVNPDWWPLGKAGKIQDVSLALAYFDGSSGWHVLILTRFSETRSQSGISGLAIQTYLLLDSIICWHSSQTWLADFPMFTELSCVLEVVSCSCFDYIIDHYLLQLGDSLDKVYQVGIAKFSKLKPCGTNYGRFGAANLEPAPALKTGPVCVCICTQRHTRTHTHIRIYIYIYNMV